VPAAALAPPTRWFERVAPVLALPVAIPSSPSRLRHRAAGCGHPARCQTAAGYRRRGL